MKIPNEWLALWRDCGASNDGIFEFNELFKAYAFPEGRFYHTLKHVRECLMEFHEVRHLAVHPREIEFALWYHDAIYDSRAKDNEERSAEMARRTAAASGISTEIAERVCSLIMATRHKAEPADPDEKLIVDVDLSILGKADDIFDRYETEIRQEYAWVPEPQFKEGRSAILRGFLARPRIYSTAFFYEKYEAKARANLARSIAKLAKY